MGKQQTLGVAGGQARKAWVSRAQLHGGRAPRAARPGGANLRHVRAAGSRRLSANPTPRCWHSKPAAAPLPARLTDLPHHDSLRMT